MTGWRWRGSVALLAVALAFVIYPVIESDVINSDWPAFATGRRLVLSDPTHLCDFDVQRPVELDVTGGRRLVTSGVQRFLTFPAPPLVALISVPFRPLA